MTLSCYCTYILGTQVIHNIYVIKKTDTGMCLVICIRFNMLTTIGLLA